MKTVFDLQRNVTVCVECSLNNTYVSDRFTWKIMSQVYKVSIMMKIMMVHKL